jgi:hypothetical protein
VQYSSLGEPIGLTKLLHRNIGLLSFHTSSLRLFVDVAFQFSVCLLKVVICYPVQTMTKMKILCYCLLLHEELHPD